MESSVQELPQGPGEDCLSPPSHSISSKGLLDEGCIDGGTCDGFAEQPDHVRTENITLDQIELTRMDEGLSLDTDHGENCGLSELSAMAEGVLDSSMCMAHPEKDLSIDSRETAVSGNCCLGRDRKNKRKRCKTTPRFVETETRVEAFEKAVRVDGQESLEIVEYPAFSASKTVEGSRVSDEEVNEELFGSTFAGEKEEKVGGEDRSQGEIQGGRFQALTAVRGAKGLKMRGNLFGMMSKIGDRKRYSCDDCGRNFNQLRVLTVHQQMHIIRRNQETSDESNEENRDGANDVIRAEKGDEDMDCSSRRNVVEGDLEQAVEIEACEDDEREVSIPRTYLQEVSEQHAKGANHVVDVPEKRKRKPKSTLLEEPSADKKGYLCVDCGKVFSLPSFLRRHRIVHTGEKPFACKFCGKCFGQKATCQRHELTHGRNKPFACSECGDGFSSSKRLQKHVKEKHCAANNDATASSRDEIVKMPKKKHVKPQKDSMKSEETVLTTEIEDQSEEEQVSTTPPTDETQQKEAKVYVCPICEKTFLQPSHLTRHSLCHTGEKPFKCKECGKGFTQKSTCLRHERSHSGELLFMCTECGNGFAQKSGLQKHRLIHTGEKPYGCRFCECRFTQKTTCKRHERIHTGEKPYICQQCGKAFGQSTSLERHVKTHMKPKLVESTELAYEPELSKAE